MKRALAIAFQIAVLSILFYGIYAGLGSDVDPTPLEPLALEPAERATAGGADSLQTRREQPAPSHTEDRAAATRDEATKGELALVRGQIRNWKRCEAAVVFRSEAGWLYFAELDPERGTYRIELAPGAYGAHFVTRDAAHEVHELSLGADERELELDFEARWWPRLAVDILAAEGRRLVQELPEPLYGWQRKEGLAALGLELECGGVATRIGDRSEYVVRQELPAAVTLRWAALVLGEQVARSPEQKLVFEVDPALFARGAPARLRFRVIEAETGAALLSARCQIATDYGSRAARTEDSQFEVADLPPGKLSLRIVGLWRDRRMELTLEPGADLDLGVIAIDPPATAESADEPLVECELHVLATAEQPVCLLREQGSEEHELRRFDQPVIERCRLPADSYRSRVGDAEGPRFRVGPTGDLLRIHVP